MTHEQIDAMIKIADRFVAVMEKRFEKEFPPETEPQDAKFVKVGDSEAKEPESREEYDQFPDGQPDTFEKILRRLQNPEA